jgi:esterase/lipase superfamily enzyme
VCSSDLGLLFGGERGGAISVGNIVVSIPPAERRKVGEVQWPARADADPSREFAVLDVAAIPREADIARWFRQRRNSRRQVLLYVHGFNNTYADAVFGFAQIVHDSGVDAAPVLFTWPSRGSVFSYLYDRDSANYSRRALEDVLLAAVRSPDVSEVTILAHSMGTWLTAEALRGIALREKGVPAKIRDVVLASPDIDVDVFRRQYLEMAPRRPRFTIFASKRDKALGVSRWLGGGIDRVGDTDLAAQATFLAELGIDVVDTSAVDTSDPLGHNTFAGSPEVVRLLGRRLARQSLDDGRVTLTDSVGLAATGAAELAVPVFGPPKPTHAERGDAKQRAVIELERRPGLSTIEGGRSPY